MVFSLTQKLFVIGLWIWITAHFDDMFLILWTFTVMLTVRLLSGCTSVASDSDSCVCTNRTHTLYKSSCHFSHHGPQVTSPHGILQQPFKNRHLWAVLKDPQCPLLPPVDTYSPLQLCCSISHPTLALDGLLAKLSCCHGHSEQMRDVVNVCVKLHK